MKLKKGMKKKNIDPRLKKGKMKITRKNGEVIYVKEEDCNRVSSKELISTVEKFFRDHKRKHVKNNIL